MLFRSEELERDVHATGFFRMKTKAIRGASEQLLSEFGGEVPGDMDSLVRLRGVGRKTASIVLGNAFGVPAIAVDRHVERVATRLGFTRKGKDGIEEELRSLYPKKDWVKATWNLVLHGRRICTPTPKCPVCPVSERHFRSEEHTSELQSLRTISYAVFCLKKKSTRLNSSHFVPSRMPSSA